jgi:hypothetical protein
VAGTPDRRTACAIDSGRAAARLVEGRRRRGRVGLGRRARVHRALAGLPILERALVANELPWSKVRLLARVASAEGEARWVARAGQRLRPGEVLELVAAEVSSEIPLAPAFAELAEEGPAPRRRESEKGKGRPAPPRAPARELPAPVAALAAGLEDADAFELDRRLRRVVRLEQTLDAAMAPLLRRVSSPQYEWRGPCHWTVERYAPEQLGISARKARALLRLERAGDVCEELRAAYRSGRLSWVKAHALLPLVLLDIEGEWRAAWVAWAERVTARRLEADVERALLLRAGHERAFARCLFHPERAQEPIPPGERQLCAPAIDLEATLELVLQVPHDVASFYGAVRETLRASSGCELGRFPSDGEVFDGLLDRALLTWTLRDPRARRPDPVMERDDYRCAVPGCTSRRNLHDHHIVFRSQQGSDAWGNRITLCAFHHQRALHAGLLRICGRAPDQLLFELGVRPGTAPLVRYRSGDVRVSEAERCEGEAWAPHHRIEPVA